jgi:6-pyruvoyltetrahydropterin/6-carboxytetrahydropterin synthase
MFEIEKSYTFEAGHILSKHEGVCAFPHGHSYKLFVTLSSRTLQKKGPKKNMIVDFHDIDKVVEVMLRDHLDHKWLNDTLKTDAPTAEFIAKWVFDYLFPHFPNLEVVSIFETGTSRASYRRK